MSNTSVEMKLKGSILRMQQVANNKNLTEYFSHLLGETKPIEFLSPLASEDFKEYQLKQLGVFEKITWGFGKEVWPDRQPQWDGIATSADGNTLYLIEAKSYINEMKNTDTEATEGKGYDNIKAIMTEVFSKEYRKNDNADFSLWMKDYYQLANRLTFLRLVKESKKYTNVKLVLLNFVNDITWHWDNKETTRYQWKKHYDEVFSQMTGSEKLPNDVVCIYLDIDNGMGDKEKFKISELNQEIQDAAKNIESFYKSSIVNHGGITVNWRWCTEYVANMIFDMDILGKFDKIQKITRENSYNRQKMHDCKSRNNVPAKKGGKLSEVQIAMHIRLNDYIDGIGKILDYQVPLKNTQDDKAGKIDLLAYDKQNKLLRILELKTNDSNESLLRAVVEGETYKRIVNQQKLKQDFGIPDDVKVVACPLIFTDRTSRVYQDYVDMIDNERPYLLTLIKDLEQQVIVIEEGLNRDIPMDAPADTRGYRVVEVLS